MIYYNFSKILTFIFIIRNGWRSRGQGLFFRMIPFFSFVIATICRHFFGNRAAYMWKQHDKNYFWFKYEFGSLDHYYSNLIRFINIIIFIIAQLIFNRITPFSLYWYWIIFLYLNPYLIFLMLWCRAIKELKLNQATIFPKVSYHNIVQ